MSLGARKPFENHLEEPNSAPQRFDASLAILRAIEKIPPPLRIASLILIPILTVVVTFRFLPIFRMADQLQRDAQAISIQTNRIIVETTVSQISSALKSLCLKTPPPAQQVEQLANKYQKKQMSNLSLSNFSFKGPKNCRATLKFKADGRPFELTVPLAKNQRWSYPKD